MAVDRTYFHPVYLDLFWCMIAERMRIYYRREEGLAPPWTNDPIMRSEFITNVYRELDPGTQYLMDNILAWEEETPEDKLFNIFIYRLMGSRESTHEALGFQRIGEYKVADAKAILKTLDVPFGEAYRTASYVDQGSKDKVTNVARLFGKLAEQIPSLWAEIGNAQKLQDVYNTLFSVKGFGDFLAYQMMVDLLYPAPEAPLIPYTQDDWAIPGPGARRGVWRLMKTGMKPGALLDVLKWLRDNQHSEFERLGLEMMWWKDAEGEDIPLSLCNIQSCLCEFFKYTRIWDGVLKYARKYNYSVPMDGIMTEPPLTFPRPPSLDEPKPDEAAPSIEDPPGAELAVIEDVEVIPEPEPSYNGEVAVRQTELVGSHIREGSLDAETINLTIISSKKIRSIHLEF